MSNRVFFSLVGAVSAALLAAGGWVAFDSWRDDETDSNRRTEGFTTCAVAEEQGRELPEGC